MIDLVEAAASHSTGKPKVLVVDDLPEKLIDNRLILQELDGDVFTPSIGAAALEAFDQQDFAVIVLDIHMDGMDGYLVAQRI